MNRNLCQEVQTWLLQHEPSTSGELLSAHLIDHVVQCAYCRGALILLLSDLSHKVPNSQPIDCDTCALDLAAYIDLEHDESALVAIQELPQVFLHLCLCVECAEIYHLTVEMKKSAALLASGRSVPRVIGQIKLPHQLIYRVLVTEQLRGIACGGEEETVLDERVEAGYRMTLRVLRQPDNTWHVTVTTIPPVTGRMVVTYGGTTFVAPFSTDGTAVISEMPAQLLSTTDGSDLAIMIEAD